MTISLPEAEQLALAQVRFVNETLEQMRLRNKELETKLGMDYAKLVGVGTVYEETICHLRKAKNELDRFLSVVRDNMRHSARVGG